MDDKAVKPKILVFSKLFWPEGGGAELATYLIVRDVLSKYFDVIVVSGTRKPAPDILRICRYIYWDILRAKYKPLEWIKIFASMDYIKRLIKESDIIHLPSHTLIPMAIIFKRLKPNVKIVIHLHNYQPLTYTSVVLSNREPDLATDIIVERWEHDSIARAMATGLLGSLNKVNILALRIADNVICVSKRQCELILKRMPWLRPKIHVVYNPPPPIPSIEKRPSTTPTLLYGGGSSIIKGIHILVKALKNLETRRKTQRLYLLITYGRVGDHQKLIEVLRRLNTKVEILGRIPYEEVLKLHRITWATLFPSINEEPMPYAVLESALLGTIPVASRVGGVPEILEGTPTENYLFTPGNIDEFTDRIESIFALSKDYLLDIGVKLRGHMLKLFNTEKIESEIAHLFGSVLN
jgi:glycosyltransferase involved in cell wall biosynthesis